MEDLYAQIEARRTVLEMSIEQDQEVIKEARERIASARAGLAALPRRPIQRRKAPELAEVVSGPFTTHVGRATITGKGTLTLTDAEGNDVTAENTVVTDHE